MNTFTIRHGSIVSVLYQWRYWVFGILVGISLVSIFSFPSIPWHDDDTQSVILIKAINKRNEAFSSGGLVSWCQPLHLRPDPENWPVVALASLPGSGNTWIRYLLMQATGIYTGSVCPDIQLKNSIFAAELVANSSVCVVKTHGYGDANRVPFDRAILLVRSPADAILADFNFQVGKKGHTGHAAVENFTENDGKNWREFVSNRTRDWMNFNLDWLENFHGPLHVVLYEQLKTDVESVLRSVTNFLDIPVSSDIMECVLERREGLFHRKHEELPIDPFTDEMKQWIKDAETKVYPRIHQFIFDKQEHQDQAFTGQEKP